MKIKTRLMTRRILVKKIMDKKFIHKSFYLLLALIVLSSHDLYIKMETYFLKPNQEATLSLYNGTFEKSENIITRDRMLDASVVAQGKRTAIKPAQWKDQDSTITQLTFNTGQAGTYVVGVSTKARNIELTAQKFNDYLKHDGVLDMLEQRTKDSVLGQDAVESYQKHVKAIYQVGDVKTNDWSTVLGYPIEFVPKANPYEKYNGEKLDVQLLLDGKPLSNQLVYADHITNNQTHTHNDQSETQDHKHEDGKHSHGPDGKKHSHGHKHEDDKHSHEHGGKKHSHDHKHGDGKHSHKHEDKQHSHADKSPKKETSQKEDTRKEDKRREHTHTNGQQLRTNEQGIVTVDLPKEGVYFLRTIYMTQVTDSDTLTHQSKWATLTFEVSHQHGANTHTHDEGHEHEGGLPTWIFILGSVAIIGLLFMIFRKKS